MNKREVLAEIDKVWDNPTYDDLLNALDIAAEYIINN